MPDSVIEACADGARDRGVRHGLRVNVEQDGSARFSCDYHPVVAGGEVVGMWADHRAHCELQARRRPRRARILREVIARVPAPMAVMWGEELVFSYVNEQALELLPDGELFGLRADEVFPAGEELAAELRAAVLGRGETVSVHEVPLGDRFWTFACVPLPGEHDRPGGVLAVGQEITAQVERRRELEAELAQEHRIATQLQVSLMPDRLPDGAGHGHRLGLPARRRGPGDRRGLLRRVRMLGATAGWW